MTRTREFRVLRLPAACWRWLLASLLALGFAQAGQANALPDAPAIQRADAIRQRLLEADRDAGRTDDAVPEKTAQWFNFPNWPNWGNWGNWRDWGNWRNW